VWEESIQGVVIAAHPGGHPLVYDLWSAWTLEPWVVFPLMLSILIYARGTYNVWKRAGRGHGITTRQWISFVGAVLVLVLALMSPLDALSADLFSAHMVQHLMLMLIAGPLLVISDFQLALLWALPRRRAQSIGSGFNQSQPVSGTWRVLNHPAFVWVLFTLAMWLWHAPLLYQAALHSEFIHMLEHLTFLIAAMLFWWVLFKHNRPDHIHYAMTIPFLFLTVLQSGILGALMTFTERPWYPDYATVANPWNLTPLEDQQLAGLIMWIPAGAVFSLLTIGFFAAWLRALERHSTQLKHSPALPTRQESK
jgi:putative membrane protein